MQNKTFNTIYDLLLKSKAIYINGHVSNDVSLTSKEEIADILSDDEDENPIVVSIYGCACGGDNFEYYFDYNDFCNAKIDGDTIVMKGENGELTEINILAPICIPDGEDDTGSETEKAYCFSCKMDMHYDEIGNCKGCGNFIDGGAV